MNATTLLGLSPRNQAKGFSLIEIMVALIIGLVSTMAIMQLFALSEGQKRTITGGGDAETNGAFALYTIQRELRQSGYGLSTLNLLGCEVLLRTGVTLSAMVPVAINHADVTAGDANTDTLLLLVGNANGASEGTGILPPSPSPAYTVKTQQDFRVNDRVIAMPQFRPSPCSGDDRLVLTSVTGIPANSKTVRVSHWVTGMSNGTLFNLGQTPKMLAYAIRGGNLTQCDYLVNNCGDDDKASDETVWVPIVNNIVSLRAQYGRDTSVPMDAVVDRYDQSVASPTTNPPVSSIQCGWARISAVRIAVVARSDQYEKAEVTDDDQRPTWAGDSLSPIDLSAGDEWQHYRYKTFETTVPLRNIILSGVQPGC